MMSVIVEDKLMDSSMMSVIVEDKLMDSSSVHDECYCRR